MNPCELTALVTALANALACRLGDADLNLLALILTQLGDTLGTITAQRACCRECAQKQNPEKNRRL